jgi:hypothetical protein
MHSPLCSQWFHTFRVPSATTPGVTYDVSFEQGSGPHCTCPSFAHAHENRPGVMPTCKHVVRVMTHACLWNQHYRGGDRTLTPQSRICRARVTPSMRCPGCGGPVVEVVR